VNHDAEIVRISSSDAKSLEIQEGKLSLEDLNHVRSLDTHKSAQRRVIARTCSPPVLR